LYTGAGNAGTKLPHRCSIAQEREECRRNRIACGVLRG
jgi:hypothetical protein